MKIKTYLLATLGEIVTGVLIALIFLFKNNYDYFPKHYLIALTIIICWGLVFLLLLIKGFFVSLGKEIMEEIEFK